MLTRMVELKNGPNEFEKLGFTDIDRVGAEGSFDIVMSLQKQTKSINSPPVTAESLEEIGADTKEAIKSMIDRAQNNVESHKRITTGAPEGAGWKGERFKLPANDCQWDDFIKAIEDTLLKVDKDELMSRIRGVAQALSSM